MTYEFPFQNPDLPVHERVTDLLQRLTPEERIMQLVYDAPAVERLGLPAYNWWNECLHGVGRAGLATVFPQAIGMAASWNSTLLGQVATAISDEARAKHHDYQRRGIRQIYTGLTYWSPNINLFRDPRWGRGQETYGECPYLTGQLAVAFVRGLQGDHPAYLKLVATVKHFAVHSGPEPERHSYDAHVTPRQLRAYYLPHFETAIRQGGARSVMGAYNRTNGEACCASPTLLETILREEWGFDGYVVSDCWAIIDIYKHHRLVKTPAQAAALAVQAGCDLNCGNTYPALRQALDKGLVTQASIDQALSRLLRARFQLGMFDPPERVAYAQIPYEVVDSPAHRELALTMARQSLVLLKNENGLLPLSKELRSLAVIGPNADSLPVLLGNYHGTPAEPVTPLAALHQLLPHTEIHYAPGCELADGFPLFAPIPPKHLRPPQGGGQGLLGQYFNGTGPDAQPVMTRLDAQIDFSWNNTNPIDGQRDAHFSVSWQGELIAPRSGSYQLAVRGSTAFSLYLDGKLLFNHQGVHEPVRRTVKRRLKAGRRYTLRLDYQNSGLDPQVQLLWAPPLEQDRLQQAIQAAQQAEACLLFLGLSPDLEGEEMPVEIPGFRGGDRLALDLPAPQQKLLESIQALGKPLVLVLLNGSALALPWADQHIPAILEAWYPGQAGGTAIAEALFGDYNPGGRLPVTFYRRVEDLPPFDDYNPAGRTYRYFNGEPLYAFGHGLSYTSFEYGVPILSHAQLAVGQTLGASITVSNCGALAGDEVVQLYLRQVAPQVERPLWELAGFQRIHLAPGESQQLFFEISAHQLSAVDEQGAFFQPPGEYELSLGGRQAQTGETSSANLRLARFAVQA